MRVARAVLWLSVLAFGGFGLAFSVAPSFMAGLVDVRLPTPTARIDVVATYGGLELGVAAFLLLCLRRDDWVRPGLLASGLCLSGLALARAAGIALARGEVDAILYALLALEIPGIAACFWAARQDVL